MQNDDILRGWKEIEKYVRMGREAILANKYPLRSELNKSVYALKSEIDAFLRREQTQYDEICKETHKSA